MDLNFNEMFGNAEQLAALGEIMKSLEAGTITPYTANTGGGALLAQDLSNDLTMQVLTSQDAKFSAKLSTHPERAKSIAFEYRRQRSLGGADPMTYWQQEGVIGPALDSTFEMLLTKCAHMSHIRQATITLMNTPGGVVPDILAKMTQDGAQQHAINKEASLFNGDNNVDAQSILGLRGYARIDSTIKDMRGADLDIDMITQYAVDMYEGAALGRPNEFYCPMTVRRQLGFEMGDRIRAQLGKGQDPMFMGGQILDEKGLKTDVGNIEAIGSRFLSPIRFKNTSATSLGPTAPATPAFTSITVAPAGGGETSQFAAADNGNYYYRVAAVGPRGVSFVTSPVQAVAAGEKVTIVLTAPSADDTRFYVVYRTKLGGLSTEFWPIQYIAQQYSGASPAATTVVDFNDDLPGTADCYLIENTPQAMCWKVHTPFTRITLPIPANTIIQPYGFLESGALMVLKKYVVRRFKNVNVPSL
jgi:hypothetical protein